jgi:dUTPase
MAGVCATVSVMLGGCGKDNSRVGPCAVTTLVFAAQPGNTTSGVDLPPVHVEAHDASGAVSSCFNGSVTVSLGSSPGGVTLSGTTTVPAVAGVATFANLRIDKAASGYTLVARADGLSAATSAPFAVAPGAATQLAIIEQPNTTVVAVGFTPAVAVAGVDPVGNIDTSYHGAVTIALATNPGNATLSGSTTVTAIAGVATFPGISLDKPGTGYTLTASAAGLTAVTSAGFTVLAQPVTRLVFTVQPGAVVAGLQITPAIAVTATDSAGHTDAHYTGDVTLAIAANPSHGSLSGTMTRTAAAGVATFADLSIDTPGTGYTLAAVAAGAIPDTSAAFDVLHAPATQLVFTVQPSDALSGGAITPAVSIAATDAVGTVDTSFRGPVTVALGANSGGGTLSGATTVTATLGVATFPGLSIDKAGTGYTLVASASGLTSATSAGFTITQSTSTLPRFGHVVIVVEENTSFSEVTDSTMPYLFSLMSQYGVATQYYANTHPSIGNYFEMTAGQIITNDDSYQLTVTADNIVRHLLAAGKTWKDYAEDLPSVGYTGPSTGNYARKHNPLSFFSDVVNDSVQVKRLVPFTQFALDLAGDTLPNYSFVVPNLCNDAHDCDLPTADNWLKANIAPLLNNPSFKQDGMLIITFDEASGDDTNGGGRVVWTVVSPKARTAYTSAALYQHQSTLRLMAEALGLASFPGDAAAAPNMAEFFQP